MKSSSRVDLEQQTILEKIQPMSLDAEEPSAFDLVNAEGKSAIVLIADHASNRVPRCLNQLGLSEEVLSSHIAWDAGTAIVARRLSELLDAPLVQSNYSRLVIDCNRAAASEQAILEVSDGIQIPGNTNLSDDHIASRALTLFNPYHDAIEALLEARTARGTVIISIHSFSPELKGEKRPWSIGVCYGDDKRLAQTMFAQLVKVAPAPVGDNRPYSIEDNIDYSLPQHAASRGLPHVMLEIRRDMIETEAGAHQFAQLIQTAWLAL